jgi:hypothetical protein
VRCLQCNCDLRGLPTTTCPECAAVNPASPPIYRTRRPDRLLRVLSFVHVLISVWPLACVAAVHITYVRAAMILGRWPIPMVDDPKGIAGVAFLGRMTEWTFEAMPLSWALAAIVPLVALIRKQSQLAAPLVFLTVLFNIIGIAALAVDPVRALEWYAD